MRPSQALGFSNRRLKSGIREEICDRNDGFGDCGGEVSSLEDVEMRLRLLGRGFDGGRGARSSSSEEPMSALMDRPTITTSSSTLCCKGAYGMSVSISVPGGGGGGVCRWTGLMEDVGF
jgi:hypothetical protein